MAEECRAARQVAGLLDITGFSRFAVTGPNAESWLDNLMASKLPKPGRAKLAPMLGEDGKLKGDLTVFNWGDGTWWIMGSYYLREWHMRWYHDHLVDGVTINDLADDICGFAVTGPNARTIMENLTEQDLCALKFMGCGEFDLGLIRAKVGRLSVTGELGYEIHCKANEHIALRRMLLEAGSGLGIKEIGFNALLSLRIEKSFGIWSAEFTQDYTAAETSMDRWIDWDKDFIGKTAALKERETGPSRVQVTLAIASDDAEATGYEPIWANGKRVGFITSGAYGHTVQNSLAMALVDSAHATPGTELKVHIVGVEKAATVLASSPYDPQGKAMRG